jgi:ribosome-binding protein aMBF1 (putative translation factor)
MKFDIERLKAMARPRSEKELEMVRFREENKDWLAVSERIALIIRHILSQKGISQLELAHRMGVSPAQVSKILSGKENLGLKTICKIELAIGFSFFKISDEKTIASQLSGETTYV